MSICQKNTHLHPKLTEEMGLDKAAWLLHATAAIDWLCRSIAVTGGRGSAHSWHPVLGWSKPYPETTGYLIPTLLDYAVTLNDDSLKRMAVDCTNWLISVQLPNGAFPGLLLGHTKPSVFNTAQILFGLSRILTEDTSNEQVRTALNRASIWLLSVTEPDGSWQNYAYVPGFTPSYYTRAVWGLLIANQIIQSEAIEDAMRKALGYYAQRFLDNHAVRDWGFHPGEPAYTHTLAYTLEGFLECGLILQNPAVVSATIEAADRLLTIREQSGGRTAGRYGSNWKADYTFICVSGNAQLSVFFSRLFDITGENKYQAIALELLLEIIDCQQLTGNHNRRGALPGSKPIWGPYLRFRYPNWAAKFFLDAVRVVI